LVPLVAKHLSRRKVMKKTTFKVVDDRTPFSEIMNIANLS
jgi:hypothetical protein